MFNFFLITIIFIQTYLELVLGQPAGCGNEVPANMTGYNGGWLSPNFPQNYPPLSHCEWRIIGVHRDGIVQIEFDGFHTVDTDFLTFYDGWNNSAPVLATVFGSAIPLPIESTSPDVYAVFDVLGSATQKGFKAKFCTDPACAADDTYRTITAPPSGYIDSQFYPEPYGPLSECDWVIQAPINTVIYFRFDDFQLERRCEGDYVRFEEGGEMLAYFCKDYPPLDDFVSTTNRVVVRFAADDNHESIGFHLYYEFQFCSPTCPTKEPPNPGDVTTMDPTAIYPIFTAFTPPPLTTTTTTPPDPGDVTTLDPAFTTVTTPPGTTTTPDIGTREPQLSDLFISIVINGTFDTNDGSTLSSDCLNYYQSRLRTAQNTKVGDLNENVIPALCAGGPDLGVHSTDSSIISMGPSSLVKMYFAMPAIWTRTFGVHHDCALLIARDLEEHSNWVQPILPEGSSGCQSVTWDPVQFNAQVVKWECPDDM